MPARCTRCMVRSSSITEKSPRSRQRRLAGHLSTSRSPFQSVSAVLAGIGYRGCNPAEREFRPDLLILDSRVYVMRPLPLPAVTCTS